MESTQNQIDPGTEITTLDFNEAFPTLEHAEHEFGISCSHPKGGSAWEFKVVEVTGRRGDLIGIQVRMFDDSWQAYADIPEFFRGLRGLGERPSLDDVKALCAELGYRDRTSGYADRHIHQFACPCGARTGGVA